MDKVLSFDAKWNVGPDSKGPAAVDGVTLRVGLASRHFASLARLAPRGIVVRMATKVAGIRGNSMIWLEDLLAAQTIVAEKGLKDSDAITAEVLNSLDLDAIGENAQTTRRSQARDRRTTRRDTAEAQREAKRAARKAKADAKKAQAES